MKKNRIMRVAALLLALTLITSCFVGSTFAKYVTRGTTDDHARVAKFGVQIGADGQIFYDKYETDTTATLTTEIEYSVYTSVIGDRLVAPGTTKKVPSITLTGTPEVAVHVGFVSDLELDKWVVADDEYYCPLIITVNDKKFDGLDYESMDAFELAVEAAIDAFSADYAPNTNMSQTGVVAVPKVTWEWPFERFDVDGSVRDDIDVKDTYLGDTAAKNVENAATISLTINTSVTQID